MKEVSHGPFWAYAREMEVQMLALLPLWRRMCYLVSSRYLWLAYMFRIRVTEEEVPPPIPNGHGETLLEVTLRRGDFQGKLGRVEALEKELVDDGRLKELLDARDKIEIACETAFWDQYNAAECSKERFLLVRLAMLLRKPQRIMRYVLRFE